MKPSPKRVIFFDIRNTLGVVDRQGHLIAFKPSSEQLLKAVKEKIGATIAVITNVPPGVDARAMLAEAGLLQYIDPNGVISTEDPDIKAANTKKPEAKVYELAAKRMGAKVEHCIYVGENLIEQLGAWYAGMSMGTKLFPPGGDFMRDLFGRSTVTEQSSGRLTELMLEEEHMVGKRIVVAAVKLQAKLAAIPPDDLAAAQAAIAPLLAPLNRLVWLTLHFIDPYHHRKEEEVLLPFALIHGYKPADLAWMLSEHEQGRQYFRAMQASLTRVQDGNLAAIAELSDVMKAFTMLYKNHAIKEDDDVFKKIGDLLTDEDDSLMVGMMQRIGPADVTVYYDMIAAMEKEILP